VAAVDRVAARHRRRRRRREERRRRHPERRGAHALRDAGIRLHGPSRRAGRRRELRAQAAGVHESADLGAAAGARVGRLLPAGRHPRPPW
jgi:hypothetical protein